MSTSGISAVAAGGLALDIAGALLIALGLMFKKPKKAIEEATPKWGFNTDLETSLACQTADAQAGAFLLVLGFAVQFAAALGWHETSWPDAVAAVASAIVFDSAVAAALFKQWRPWQLRRML